MPIEIQSLVSASLLLGFTGSGGSQGATGYTGSQGNIGFTGSQGATGSTGATGFTGSIGVGFTGSQGPTTIAASALTGTTLASGVTASSLTSVGTLSSLTVSGNVTVDTNTLFVDATNDRVGIRTTSPAHALHIAGTTYLQQIIERATVSATAATGTIAYDALTQAVLFYTTNASANWTLNLRGNASTTMNTLLAVGDSITMTFMARQGGTAYYPTGHQIDGTSVTVSWQGGTAPTAGNANSLDVYTYTVIKTAATPTYTVLGSQTRFA
jgi:hypothetical protein